MLSLQLQKSPAADFEEKCGNSPDVLKGFSQSGMSKFESSAFCQASQETREWAADPGFSRIHFGLWSPGLPKWRRKSAKVSGILPEYSRFGETMGGDRFDQTLRT